MEIHKAYLRAGANIITTNTFGANRLKYPDGGKWKLEDLVEAAVKNGIQARRQWEEEQSGRENLSGEKKALGIAPAYIALDLGPTGKLLKPLGGFGI